MTFRLKPRLPLKGAHDFRLYGPHFCWQRFATADGQREPPDSTRGFHPLISMYYLAREKQERERVYGPGQFASSQLSIQEAASTAVPNGPVTTTAAGEDVSLIGTTKQPHYKGPARKSMYQPMPKRIIACPLHVSPLQRHRTFLACRMTMLLDLHRQLRRSIPSLSQETQVYLRLLQQHQQWG